MSNVIGPIDQSDWLNMQRTRAGIKQLLSLPSEKYYKEQQKWKDYYQHLKDKYCA